VKRTTPTKVKTGIPTKEKSFLRRGRITPSERLSLKSNFLSLREKFLRSRPSLPKKKKDD